MELLLKNKQFFFILAPKKETNHLVSLSTYQKNPNKHSPQKYLKDILLHTNNHSPS